MKLIRHEIANSIWTLWAIVLNSNNIYGRHKAGAKPRFIKWNPPWKSS